MPKPLVFMMGRSPAMIATDRRYARNHMWMLASGDVIQLGLSAYGVRLLGDAHYLRWSVAPGAAIRAGQAIGVVEGSKAISDLYAPTDGTIAELNPAVLADPSLLNSNLYDTGWLLAVRGRDDLSLAPEEYVSHLEACWPLAQRLLKGQTGQRSRGSGSGSGNGA